uniref:Uncharacterized protein n=1 Tax=Chromera velia CCMP2878 TaxID=1169474 RepID=A0A0G4HWN7_9ALVE|eukprot:Cvel_9109.t1-p1 / transcript=Cvel_9109.t1 / gene=Cvel_9109 / organism=Chromera_velia_CCMP2878 / gene_product=hypothetical protein / transcript_product=hypothetical protein / location=Cvel_scaffold517:38720-40515(-) / protein_length=343 / sequence_SO=supercontig / SO=protein_coding / is_pseudo=false
MKAVSFPGVAAALAVFASSSSSSSSSPSSTIAANHTDAADPSDTIPRCLDLETQRDRFLMLGSVGDSLAGWTEMGAGNYTFEIAMPGVCPVSVDVVNFDVLEVVLDAETPSPSFWNSVVGETETETASSELPDEWAECENLSAEFTNWQAFTMDNILMEMLMNVRNPNASSACWETSVAVDNVNGTVSLSVFMHVDFKEGTRAYDNITAVVWNLREMSPAETAERIESHQQKHQQQTAANDEVKEQEQEEGQSRLLRDQDSEVLRSPLRQLFGGARRVGRRAGRRSRTVVGGAVRGAGMGAPLAGRGLPRERVQEGARSSFRSNVRSVVTSSCMGSTGGDLGC